MALSAPGSLEHLICAEDKKNGSTQGKSGPRALVGTVILTAQLMLKQGRTTQFSGATLSRMGSLHQLFHSWGIS